MIGCGADAVDLDRAPRAATVGAGGCRSRPRRSLGDRNSAMSHEFAHNVTYEQALMPSEHGRLASQLRPRVESGPGHVG